MSGARVAKQADAKEGKPKKNAINAALDRVSLLATKRGEAVTEEIKAAINAKAEEIWKK